MCVLVQHTVERAGAWAGPAAWQRDLPSRTQLGILLLELYSSPHPPAAWRSQQSFPRRGPARSRS